MGFKFTNRWFEVTARTNFQDILPSLRPVRIVEVGCYEGQATAWMAGNLSPEKLVCIDTFAGGMEHQGSDMEAVWSAFLHNRNLIKETMGVDVEVIKACSDHALMSLGNREPASYDFVYIDGSHQAADVLTDAVLGLQLLRKGGVMAFDDYAWLEKPNNMANPLDNPRLGIDSFFNVFRRQIRQLASTTAQFWVVKL